MIYPFLKNKCKKMLPFAFVLLLTIAETSLSFGQPEKKLDSIQKADGYWDEFFPLKCVGFFVKGGFLLKAKHQTFEGGYDLHSNPHPAYSGGIQYIFNLDNNWSLYSGVSLVVTKSVFFGTVPVEDLQQMGVNWNSPLEMSDNQAFYRIAVPIMMTRRFHFRNQGFWDIRAGIHLNYSGFSSDWGLGMSVLDTNNRFIEYFDGIQKSNNNGKPWISFTSGVSKNWILKNKNLIGVSFLFEWSNSDYLIMDYKITIPNRPVTRGRYSVTGSGLGLSVHYIFTKAKKRMEQINKYRNKKAF